MTHSLHIWHESEKRAAQSSPLASGPAGPGGLGQIGIPFREVNHQKHKEAYLTLGSMAFSSEQTRHSLNNKSLKKDLNKYLRKIQNFWINHE